MIPENLPQKTNDIEEDSLRELDSGQLFILLLSILIVALCGIAYELIIGTISSYLLGNSVYQFSLTIGLFMFAMGIGSFISKLFMTHLVDNFVIIEIVVSIIGGLSGIALIMSFPFVRPLYMAVMFGLIIIIGTLVGLEIPILTRILSRKESIRNSIAHVLALDYVGALIGSVMFPLFLLPFIGLIRSSFAIGLANILIALLNIYFFRNHLRKPRLFAAAGVFTACLLVSLTILGSRMTEYAEQKLYFDDVVYEKQTPYQRIVVTRPFTGRDHRLYLDGHIQFSERDEYRYHEALVHPIMSVNGPRKNILILGGGDGMAAREVLKYPQVERIHLVDIDPEMTRLCSQFPAFVKLNGGSLLHPKVTIINKDAFSFMNQPGILYHRVIIDLPDPHNEALNKLYSKEFYTIIRRRMDATGLLVTQSSSPFFTRKTYWCIERTLREVPFYTFSYHMTIPAFGIWGFHMASIMAPPPETFDITVPTKYIDASVMASAAVFGKDIRPVNTPVNTVMEPVLYTLYVKELSK